MRRHVECFVLANAGVGASSNVADGVAASLTCSNARGREAAHQAWRVVDLHVMELEILPRGDVRDAVGIFFGQLGHGLELCRVEPARGNLDALHARRVPHSVRTLSQFARRKIQPLDFLPIAALAIVVTLAVSASAQPRLGEETLVQFSLLAQGDVGFKRVNFAGQILRDRLPDLAGELFFPKYVRSFHKFHPQEGMALAVPHRAHSSPGFSPRPPVRLRRPMPRIDGLIRHD